jgi:hypothetical protein
MVGTSLPQTGTPGRHTWGIGYGSRVSERDYSSAGRTTDWTHGGRATPTPSRQSRELASARVPDAILNYASNSNTGVTASRTDTKDAVRSDIRLVNCVLTAFQAATCSAVGLRSSLKHFAISNVAGMTMLNKLCSCLARSQVRPIISRHLRSIAAGIIHRPFAISSSDHRSQGLGSPLGMGVRSLSPGPVGDPA